jgi:hypothetical protein
MNEDLLSDAQKLRQFADAYEVESGSQLAKPFASADVTGLLSVKVHDDGADLLLIDRVIKIRAEHEQYCCENVYADWDYLRTFVEASSDAPNWLQFHRLELCGVKDSGVLLRFVGDGISSSFFTPCYNEQNGYYSSNLTFLIDGKAYDASSFVKDDIYLFP